MDTTYDPQAIEQLWYEFWEKNGYFKASPAKTADAEPYCIAIPPPNVTGTLHMGHAFQHTLMDILIRFNRMKGNPTLWQVGTDHAGIATQMVVERRLNAEGIKRHDLGREKFLEKIWEWKEESGGTICEQMRRMGNSVDWERERFTMDEGLSEAVQEVFIRLFDEGIIYRGKRLVNWDPVLQTAISDLEVISEEENGHMWHMRYPIVGTDEHLIVATTRPETMLGDSAVAVHPRDERYQALVGKMIELPLTGRQIPIIADDYVDPEFGTGCVKITPAHDFNDYQVGQRHDLPLINIFNDTAHINDDAPEAYRGLERYAARKQIVADLDAAGLLEKIADHKLMVPRGDRTNVVIEPYLTDQWYVGVESLAKPAIEAVENGDIRFVPENWSKTYFNWMRNLDDWCISRQLWWGHRIPAWFDADGNIYVAKDEASVREKYHLASDVELNQETDVLDTWFSSALWPFSTLGWPEKTPELEQFYPNNVLVTGFDIIFFWVARMVMFGQKFMDDVPFKDVYITGLIRDENGHKMSKSKGNTLDPLDLIDGIDLESLVAKRTSGMMQPQLAAKIEKSTRKQFPDGITGYGTDALRFTLASLASTGRDIRFDMQRMEGYRNFCNKIWNAARYVLMNTEAHAEDLQNDDVELSLADKWIIGRLQHTEQEVTRLLEQYRFDLAANEIYEFTWNQYCDWYIELSKPVLNNPDASEAQLRGTRRTLVRVLETLLRLSHPFIPFVTEAIWQTVAPLAGQQGESICSQDYPVADLSKVDDNVNHDIEWIKQFVMGIRKIRSEMNVAPSKGLTVILDNASDSDQNRLKANSNFLKTLARLESVSILETGTEAPESAIALVGEMKLLIPLAGIIDKDAELARLDREIAKANAEIENVNKKLANKGFVDKAPEAVVNKEKAKLQDAQSRTTELQAQRNTIANMS